VEALTDGRAIQARDAFRSEALTAVGTSIATKRSAAKETVLTTLIDDSKIAVPLSLVIGQDGVDFVALERRRHGTRQIDYLVYLVQNDHMKPQRRREQPAAVRNARGEVLALSSVTASEAKTEFARVLEIATQGGAVVITKHDAPKAIVLSVENFNALAAAAETTLDTLDREFDALLARMQRPKARRGMKTAFDASVQQLGRAAVAATRRRG
jgi:prevent-host-death family protein